MHEDLITRGLCAQNIRKEGFHHAYTGIPLTLIDAILMRGFRGEIHFWVTEEIKKKITLTD